MDKYIDKIINLIKLNVDILSGPLGNILSSNHKYSTVHIY